MPTLSNLLQRLADSGVDFVIIGGFVGVLSSVAGAGDLEELAYKRQLNH